MKSKKIFELYACVPLSSELLHFIDTHKDFEESLKISNYPRFIFIPHIMLSCPKAYKDEVIGMFYYDTQEKFYKQDYVVNVNFRHEEYVSYSRRRKDINETKYSKSLDTFFEKYGKWDGNKGKFYCRGNHKKPWMHHYTFSDLPNEEFKSSARIVLERHNINVEQISSVDFIPRRN